MSTHALPIRTQSEPQNASQSAAVDWTGALGRWMIFLAGLAILVSALILPAQADLRHTRTQRDRALHIEQAHHTRIDRYQGFLGEIKSPSASTIDLLAMSQLGMIASNRQALIAPGQPADPQLFEYLEPVIPHFVPAHNPPSRLEEFSTGQRSRLWFVLIGAVAVLYGLMPPAK